MTHLLGLQGSNQLKSSLLLFLFARKNKKGKRADIFWKAVICILFSSYHQWAMSRQNSKLASPESSVIVTSSYWKRETKEVSNIYYSFFMPNIEGTPTLNYSYKSTWQRLLGLHCKMTARYIQNLTCPYFCPDTSLKLLFPIMLVLSLS